jgi:WD repeat-containing protein 19
LNGPPVTESSEHQKVCFRQALGLNRFQVAFKIGLTLKSKDMWIAMGRRCLECLDIGWAKKAYRQAPAPGMVLYLDRIQSIEDKQLLSGHVACLLGRFHKARDYFLHSCCPEAALDMHCDFYQWDQALSLAQSLAPHRLPDIFLNSALQLEAKGEHQQAFTHFEQAVRKPGGRSEFRKKCRAGIARTSIRLGDLQRGMDEAKALNDKEVCKECAGILERPPLRQNLEAAQLYEEAGCYDKAAGLYIQNLNFEQAAPLMSKIHTPKLHIQYAKAKETSHSYREASKAYERARDYDSVVRLCLEHLNEPQRAFQLVRDMQLASGAERVAEYCRKQGNIACAVEFLLLAKNDQEAFHLAERHDKMDKYEEGLAEKGTREQHMRIAGYYEQRNMLGHAAKHYSLCEEYAIAVKLYLKVGEKEIDNAIEVVGKARSDALTHTLIDYLMGESDNVPKDPNYVYRLHKALGNFMQAAGTALIIAKQEQEMGNYRHAHTLLFRTYQDLKSQKLALPHELWRRLMILHSYMVVRRLVKVGDHRNAAQMLLRVAKNIQQFPAHLVPLLTSCVIECQRAKMSTEAYQYACTLMQPQNRPNISEQYKKKIENIVRKPLTDDAKELDEPQTPCMYCNFMLPESQLDCPNCKNISPFCIITGMRMTRDDWTYCTSCFFPARRSAFITCLQTVEACPMCDAPQAANDLPIVTDPSALIADYKSLFQNEIPTQ